ncbi:hypothetical protein M9458_016023, partial [Cirrhinus mrigala]
PVTLHAMAIPQVHQAKALKELHQGGPDPRLMQELRTATDFALRATKVTARSLGRVTSTMVVQERHLWLNLAQMSDTNKVRFLDAPISQAGLFGNTFLAVQKQTEAILFTSVHSDTDASVLRAEVAVLLAKNAIEPVPPAEMKSGFYSPYFIVPKKSGGLPFKMLIAKRILSCVHHQDWFAAIDLKDAYFYVLILSQYRPFLRFAFEARAYQYKVLPFGPAPLWERGICILNHLDDWLIIAHSRDLLCEHRDLVLRHLSLLGLQVNWEKSKLSSVQSISFLGMELDSVNMSARLTDERVHGPSKTFSEAYGSRSRSYATWGAPYETVSALAIQPDPDMGMAPWHVPDQRYPGISYRQVHVVVHIDAFKSGWGAICNLFLDRTSTAVAHQLPRVACSASCIALVLAML